jgi:hypothetical protein
MKTIRRLKVEPPAMKIPSQIRLKGKWLEEAGFKPNDYVSVSIETGKIIIELERYPQSVSGF